MSGEKERSFEEKLLNLIGGKELAEEDDLADLDEFSAIVKRKVGYLSPEVLDEPKLISNDAKLKLVGIQFNAYKDFEGDPKMRGQFLKGMTRHWLELCKWKVQRPQDPRVHYVQDLLEDAEMRKLLRARQILEKGRIADEKAVAMEVASKLFNSKTYDGWYSEAALLGKYKGITKVDIVKLIAFRRAQMEKREREFQEKLPGLMAKVRARILAAKDRFGWDLQAEKIDHILGKIKVFLANLMVARFEEELSGNCNMHKLIIYIDPDLDDEKMEHIMVHEVLHALSGKSFLYEEGNKLVQQLKGGMLFPNFKGGTRDDLFEWLNESVTEKLAMMADGATRGSYEEERKILAELCKKVPFELFQAAYFEDYDEKQPAGKTTAKFTALSEAIRNAFGDRFLVRLDNYIAQKGAKAAYEKFFGEVKAELAEQI